MKLNLRSNSRSGGLITIFNYLECLQALKARLDSSQSTLDTNLEMDSQVVLSPLTTASSGLRGFEPDHWSQAGRIAVFKTISDFSSQPVYRRQTMTEVANIKPLLNLNEIVSFEHSAVCWSQTAFPVYEPTKEVLRNFDDGRPPAKMVWRHLLYLSENAMKVDVNSVQEFVAEVCETYTYLQQHSSDADLTAEVKTQAIWLNLHTFESALVTLDDIQNGWTPTNNLVLFSACDSQQIKAVKPGLMHFATLLKAVGCKTLKFPKIDKSTLKMDRPVNPFNDFRKKGLWVDITLKTENQEIHAHKLVLSSVSEMCKAHFLGDWLHATEISYGEKEGVTAVFLSHHTLSRMVDYAYANNIDWTDMQVSETDNQDGKDRKLELLLDLHAGADFWRMPGLMSEVEAKIVDSAEQLITIANVFEVQERAVQVRAFLIATYCRDFIEDNDLVEYESEVEDEEEEKKKLES